MTITPFGRNVVPLVYLIVRRSRSPTDGPAEVFRAVCEQLFVHQPSTDVSLVGVVHCDEVTDVFELLAGAVNGSTIQGWTHTTPVPLWLMM